MCESKVDDFDAFGLLFIFVEDDHDILGFEVSVYDSYLMEVFDSEDELPDDFGCDLFFHGALLPDVFEQVFAFDELCDDVEVVFGLDALFVEDEEGVVEDAHDAAFVAMINEKFTQLVL